MQVRVKFSFQDNHTKNESVAEFFFFVLILCIFNIKIMYSKCTLVTVYMLQSHCGP